MPKYDLIAQEIKWCEAHRNPEQEVYQDGFIAGLRHALFLMKSRSTDLPIICDNCFTRRASGDLCGNCGSPNIQTVCFGVM